jgi:cytochrome c553
MMLKLTILCVTTIAALGCRQDMFNQPKAKPMAASDFFDDGAVERSPPEGTIARGHLHSDTALFSGKEKGQYLTRFPIRIDRAAMERGRERYDIFCAPCHDQTGRGEGIIVKHGFRRPASFHEQRLRDSSPGYFFDAMTNGFGTMYPLADRLSAEDRWRIAAYIRALQRADAARLEDIPPEQVGMLARK